MTATVIVAKADDASSATNQCLDTEALAITIIRVGRGTFAALIHLLGHVGPLDAP
jgi:hypothetical protein